MANYSKYKLITMHSATNSKQKKILFFNKIEKLMKYLSVTYMISFPKNINDNDKLEFLSKNDTFNFKPSDDNALKNPDNFLAEFISTSCVT